MEWGIKLKTNNATKKILNKIYKELVLKVIIYIFMSISIFFLMLLIIKKFDFQWLYNYDYKLYYFMYDLYNNSFYYIFIVIVGLLTLIYIELKKIFSYISSILDISDKLFDKNIEYITLPEELSAIEKNLNYFKRESLKNEELAKEKEKQKDELIVYLAHDIKTPLTSMIGYLSLLDEIEDMPKQKRKKYINVALDKSYRLEELINELFDIARFNSEKIILEKEKINLNLMIEQIIDDYYPILKDLNKKIIFNNNESIFIYADSDKLSRVFNNLIKNAINYSEDNSNININIFKKSENIIIKIINSGKEIPKEKLDRIFEQFYRLDSSRTSKIGGSGLGLAIAKNIVELHNGNIKADSKDNKTTFTVKLPININ